MCAREAIGAPSMLRLIHRAVAFGKASAFDFDGFFV